LIIRMGLSLATVEKLAGSKLVTLARSFGTTPVVQESAIKIWLLAADEASPSNSNFFMVTGGLGRAQAEQGSTIRKVLAACIVVRPAAAVVRPAASGPVRILIVVTIVSGGGRSLYSLHFGFSQLMGPEACFWIFVRVLLG